MNENVIKGLNAYLIDTDPQYAVLLKGNWGCGKTFLIRNWIDTARKESQSETDTVYVSLFGISSIPALMEKINMSLSPLLYKTKKISKKILKIAGKVALKYDSTFDDIQDAKLSYEINPIDLLSIDDEGNMCKASYTLFVFDDVERCKIVSEELFGFIDYLQNQVGCKVIIILGDLSHHAELRNALVKYQEKIIGREYEVQPDVKGAIHSFVCEMNSTHPNATAFMNDYVDALTNVFSCSGYNNLRSLRNAMHQFADIFEQLSSGATDFKMKFLLQYIGFALEYYNGDKDFITSIEATNFYFYRSRKDSKEQLLREKYLKILQKYRVEVFNPQTVDIVHASIVNGEDDIAQINAMIDAIEHKALSSRLRNIWDLENEAFDELIHETQDCLSSSIKDMSEYLFAFYMMCYLESLQAVSLESSFEDDCYMRISKWIDECVESSNMVGIHGSIIRALNSLEHKKELNRFSKIETQLRQKLEQQKAKIQEPLVVQLEKIDDDSIDKVLDMMNDADPYGRANYNMQSIFHKVDINKMSAAIFRLSNCNKRRFANNLEARYQQNWRTQDYEMTFHEEKNSLEDFFKIVCLRAQKTEKMERLAIIEIKDQLQSAISLFSEDVEC